VISPIENQRSDEAILGRETSAPVFLFQGNGSLLNRGCEAILRSTVDLLRSEFGVSTRFINAPASSVADPGCHEEDTFIEHSYPAPIRRFRTNWLRYQYYLRIAKNPLAMSDLKMTVSRHIHEADATLILGGDTYTLDYGVPRVYFAANRHTLNAKKPLIFWGATIGPFSRVPEFEKEAAEELKRVTRIYAREPLTVSYLRGLGVTENVSLSSDAAFALEPEKPMLDSDLRAALSMPCIGLNLSRLVGRYKTDPKTWIQEAVALVDAMLHEFRDYQLVLVPHVFLPGNNDYLFMKEVVTQLRCKERARLIDVPYNARQLKWILSQMQAFAGARTHSTIAALSSGVPTTSIGYSRKAEGINLQMFGHTDWVLPVKELTPESLCQNVGDLLDQRDSVVDELQKQTATARARAVEATRDLRCLLQAASA